MPSRAVLVLVVAMLAGCPAPTSPPSSFDAAAEVVDSGPALIIDAGPPPPTVLSPTGSWILPDGGTATLQINAAGRAEIEPAIGLNVFLPVLLKDWRLRMLDGQDKVLESDDTFSVTDAGVDGKIRFLEPLKPGRDFQLMLDAQLGTQVTDVQGRVFEEFELKFHTLGEYVPDAKPGRPAKKKGPTRKK